MHESALWIVYRAMTFKLKIYFGGHYSFVFECQLAEVLFLLLHKIGANYTKGFFLILLIKSC